MTTTQYIQKFANALRGPAKLLRLNLECAAWEDAQARADELNHAGLLVMNRWTRCFLTDEYHEFAEDYKATGAGVAAMLDAWIKEGEQGHE